MRGETDEGDGGGDEWNDTVRGAATGLADVVRTTLGPNGMDKMVVGENGTVIVTNDGSRIVDWMDIVHPIGRCIERAAQAQDDAVGDGTTTTVVLAAALLDEAATLRDEGVHPTTVVDGYARATELALERLEECELAVNGRHDDRLDHVAQTAVTGRWDDASTERFADLTLDALRRVEFDTSKLTLESVAGGELRESSCLDGILVDLESSSTSLEGPGHGRLRDIERPAIAMVDAEVGVPEPSRVESVRFETAAEREAFQTHDRERRDAIVEAVKRSGATVLVSQKAIDETVRAELIGCGILPVERTRRDEFDVIARATGATPAASVDELTASDTGAVESVERRTAGSTEMVLFRGCPHERRVSLLLRGGTPHVASEVRRIITDCIAVTRSAVGEGALLPGGGAAPTALAVDLATSARGIADRRQLVVDGFASALREIPRTLAANAGTDAIAALAALKQRHGDGETTVGIGVDGSPCEMVAAGVLEPAPVFRSALRRAVAVATTVIRIDDIVRIEGEQTERDDHAHAHEATGGYPWAVGH